MRENLMFNKNIVIGDRLLNESSETFIIAEAGVNHNGNTDIALELVDAACMAGVDAIKFQMFNTDDLALRGVEKAPYQKLTTCDSKSQYEMLKSLELGYDSFKKVKDYCKMKGLLFLCTPFEQKSLEQLDSLGVNAFKVSATDITNIQFLKQIALKGKPMIISCGMCYLSEIKKALEVIHDINQDVVLLQCTSNYPVEEDEVNLRVIDTFKEEFSILIGYSDHSKGIGAAPYAVAKGAKVIEKHFTLDREMLGPDHKASLTPVELKNLVREVRKVERFLGTPIKSPTISECCTRKSLQKCFVAKTSIKAGDLFNPDNIVAKRTNGEGISAVYYEEIVGRVSERDYAENEIIVL